MSTGTLTESRRSPSVDILRGAVMVLMAIDHVRVYSGLPAGGNTAGIFFTRWITHFCAPAFAFLAGTSILLYGIALNNKKKLAAYLITRGLFLVVLELTLIRFCWTFNLDLGNFILAGIIWMLGWCMVLMAVLIWLRTVAVAIIGLLIIFLQQLFEYVPRAFPANLRIPFGKFWEFIYPSGIEGPAGISILYVLVPWIGVMAAGYGFGLIVRMDPVKRRRICLWTGLSCIILFIVIGCTVLLRQPTPENAPPFLFRLLNQKKYPASQLFLLMTLGPVIALVPYAEKAKGWLSRVLTIFGRVPMFYYLLHIPLIHISALLVNYLLTGQSHQEWYTTAPYVFLVPDEQKWQLGMLYLVYFIDLIILFFACRWYASYKRQHSERRWMKLI
jgi:uncharacterized membrane protein